jgi:hypothetical protein
MEKWKSEINGNLDIFISETENEFEGEIVKWKEVLIHGDSEGLMSFANLLTKLAELNQNEITDLPSGAREHIHLQPNFDLSKSSIEVIVGRLDAKGTNEFYKRFIGKENNE